MEFSAMRVRKRGLQVAKDTYRDKTGHTVTVQGVVHLAEQSFWDYLAEQIRKEEAKGAEIHFELVANDLPERPDFLKMSEIFTKLLPSMVYQSEGVRLKGHWRNTDLKMSEFLDLLGEERVKKLKDIAKQQKEVYAEIEKSVSLPLVEKIFKRVMVYMPLFGPLISRLMKKADPLPMDIVLTKRNNIAIEAALHTEADVFCFWGAAHLPGIGYGLKEAGYKRISRSWTTAVQL